MCVERSEDYPHLGRFTLRFQGNTRFLPITDGQGQGADSLCLNDGVIGPTDSSCFLMDVLKTLGKEFAQVMRGLGLVV